MIEKTLEQIGLTPSESKAYLAALKLGPVSVVKLASEIGLTRMATYNLIETLADKGLFGKTKLGKKEKIVAQDPNRLILRISEQKRNLDQQEEKIKQVISELKSFFSASQVKPRMTVYEGIEGLKTVYEDTLKTLNSGDEFVAYGSPEEASEALPNLIDLKKKDIIYIFDRGIQKLKTYVDILKSKNYFISRLSAKNYQIEKVDPLPPNPEQAL